MRPSRVAAALAPGLLSACVEYNLGSKDARDPKPFLEVWPEIVDFGALDGGGQGAAALTLANTGEGTLTIASLSLEGPGAFTLSTAGTALALEPGQRTEALLTYTPWSVDDEGLVRVTSDDPLQPEVEVPLYGALDVPLLVFSPDPLDFGAVPVGEQATEPLAVTNAGAADLVITGMMVLGDEFTADLPALPLTLAPGASEALPVTFGAAVEGAFEGRLWAESNAGGGSDSVLLQGQGSDGPIAVCWADPDEVSSHDETVDWVGSESYDPTGAAIVDYTWTLLSRPNGSSATMPAGGADRDGFEWDLAGMYVAVLTVENEHGQTSLPCYATLEAVPSDTLWVEMFWEHQGDDMDLHLLAPGGSKWTSLDCHWKNCVGTGLDWGMPVETTDDPSLDLDDIPGTGPENIRVEEPEDGEFTVLVHDYGSSRYKAANAVTVNIYVGGELVWSDTRELEGEEGWESFATVSFPSGVVTPL